MLGQRWGEVRCDANQHFNDHRCAPRVAEQILWRIADVKSHFEQVIGRTCRFRRSQGHRSMAQHGSSDETTLLLEGYRVYDSGTTSMSSRAC